MGVQVRRSSILEFALVLLCVLVVAAGSAAQDEPVRVATDLVTIPLTVRDRDGRYVPDLKREDFRIFENGEEQQVAFFETTEQPVSIFFLLDLSRSMEGHQVELASAANTFLNNLRPMDYLSVAYFCDYTKSLYDRDSVENIRSTKVKLEFCGKTTMLYDAMEYAFKKVKKVRGRKAMVLFSDGIDAGAPTSRGTYFVTAKSSLRAAEEFDAPIFSVQFATLPSEPPKSANKADWAEGVKEVNSYMRNLAEITGGRYFRVENISNLGEAFAKVAQELSQQYSLGYYPKEPGKKGERRDITVKVNIPNAAVRARSSYVVGSTKK